MSEGGRGGASAEGAWGGLCIRLCEITHGTEKADEKFHFYFLTKSKWVLKD